MARLLTHTRLISREEIDPDSYGPATQGALYGNTHETRDVLQFLTDRGLQYTVQLVGSSSRVTQTGVTGALGWSRVTSTIAFDETATTSEATQLQDVDNPGVGFLSLNTEKDFSTLARVIRALSHSITGITIGTALTEGKTFGGVDYSSSAPIVDALQVSLIYNSSDEAPFIRADGGLFVMNAFCLAGPSVAGGFGGKGSTIGGGPGEVEIGTLTIRVPSWPSGGGFHEISTPLYGTQINDVVPGFSDVLTQSLDVTITGIKSLRYGHNPADIEALATTNPVWNASGSAVLNPRTATV